MEDKYLEMIENLCILNGKYEAIIESSTNGIIELAVDGTILTWNPSFSNIFNYHGKEGKSIFSFIKNRAIANDVKNFLEQGNEILFREFIIQVIGQNEKLIDKFIEFKLIPIPTAHKTVFIGIIKDKSDVLLALTNREKYISKLLGIIEDIKVDNRNTIYHLASIVELRDNVTGKHLERVEAYTRLLATAYMHKFSKRDTWVTENYVEDMAVSSVLHDIGKVGISDTILLKPDHLSDMEMDAMKQHTLIAGKALEKYRGKKEYLSMGREIALTHHEKWNGKGYPRQLKGKDIPLSGRIVSLCDTYDAITNERPYKTAQDHEKAVQIISSQGGISFDPEIVEIFLSIHGEFQKINETMAN